MLNRTHRADHKLRVADIDIGHRAPPALLKDKLHEQTTVTPIAVTQARVKHVTVSLYFKGSYANRSRAVDEGLMGFRRKTQTFV